MVEPSFRSSQASTYPSQQQSAISDNPLGGDHDQFSKYSSSQTKDFVTVPIQSYELFKGIALEFINLQRTEPLLVSDLTI